MPRATALIACAIACMILCPCTIPASATIGPAQDPNTPWVFGGGWSFTWVIDQAPSIYERNTRIRFTVHAIQDTPVVPQGITRKMVGNLSRELDLGGGPQWTPMATLVSIAEYQVGTEVYSLTTFALGNNMLVIPAALTIPMFRFKIAFASRCNDTAWNITIDDVAFIFDARNKTFLDQRVRIDFNDKGVVEDLLTTYQNGTTEFHMKLESSHDPNSGLSVFINVLTLTSIGAVIAVIIALLFKKYKIKAKDLVTRDDVPPGEDEEDPEHRIPKGDAF
ncbi:MAG: hypothetical protein GYA24_19365 [Candidatus Lokiarchaeota archaeon]|nr:hypothetical protein [Candidatus Lokiarchaeota archaeon]